MKIALLHYHLKTGGVAAVVRQQARALQNVCRVGILTGETDDTPLPADTVVIPELAYTQSVGNPDEIADAVTKALDTIFSGPCDVLHVHNPTLTKNVNFLKIIAALQQRGVRMLMQVHDFAEDGRPQSYSSADPYPLNCHYAVINSRDYRLLVESGLNPKGVHLLPNMIGVQPDRQTAGPNDPLVLYPVRAIRRKNLGEAILLSLYMAPQDRLGITLPPNSPADWPSYRLWKAFVSAHQLRVQFELGEHYSFQALMRRSKYTITTSIAEGFGFSFLEPWMFGKSLLGRKLPAVCRDFDHRGIRLNHLYTRLRIPLNWLDLKGFYQKWSDHLERAAQRYDTSVPENRIRTAFKTMTAGGDLDFSILDQTSQQIIIGRLIKNRLLRERLQAHNPFLRYFSENPVGAAEIMDNQRAIQRQYSARAYLQQLLEIYSAVKENKMVHQIDKKRLLAEFLSPPAVSMLRWDPQSG